MEHARIAQLVEHFHGKDSEATPAHPIPPQPRTIPLYPAPLRPTHGPARMFPLSSIGAPDA